MNEELTREGEGKQRQRQSPEPGMALTPSWGCLVRKQLCQRAWWTEN